jgi:hypothetical protein
MKTVRIPHIRPSSFVRPLLTLLCLLLALPVVGVLAAWFELDAAAWATLVAPGLDRAAGLFAAVGRAQRRRGHRRDAARHGDRRGGDAVRLSRPPDLRMGPAAAAGDAGLCAGLRLDRRAAAQWPAAGLAAWTHRRPRRLVARRCAAWAVRWACSCSCSTPTSICWRAPRLASARRSCSRRRACSAPACAGVCWRWRCRWRGRRSPPAWRWR